MAEIGASIPSSPFKHFLHFQGGFLSLQVPCQDQTKTRQLENGRGGAIACGRDYSEAHDYDSNSVWDLTIFGHVVVAVPGEGSRKKRGRIGVAW